MLKRPDATSITVDGGVNKGAGGGRLIALGGTGLEPRGCFQAGVHFLHVKQPRLPEAAGVWWACVSTKGCWERVLRDTPAQPGIWGWKLQGLVTLP